MSPLPINVATGRALLAPSGGMDLILSDTFTDTNGVNIDAHVIAPINKPGVSWVQSGGHTIQSNRAQAASQGTPTVALGIADFYATSLHGNSGSAGFTGIAARYVDGSNLWRLGYNASNTVLSITERNAGVNTTRASASTITKSTIDFNLVSTVRGQLIICTRVEDGVTVSYASASFQQTTTTHGFSSGALNIQCDNINFWRFT